MHDTINGAMFKEMLLFGTVSIAQAQQAINDLNVFPVPRRRHGHEHESYHPDRGA